MEKKLNYSREIISELRLKIEASEQKVNLIQNQAYIIKNNAQYKKVAKVDEMIDDCSYSLWMKDKLEAEEILQCSNYLKSMADELELKGEEIIDLLADKKEFNRKIEEHKELIA